MAEAMRPLSRTDANDVMGWHPPAERTAQQPLTPAMVKGSIKRAGWWSLPCLPLVEGEEQTVNPPLMPDHPGTVSVEREGTLPEPPVPLRFAQPPAPQDGRKADTSRNALVGGGDEPPPQRSKNRQSLVCQVGDYRERPPRKEKAWHQEDSRGWGAKLGSSTGGTLQVTRQRPWTRVCYCDY